MTLIPEPTLDDLLADPLVDLVMRSDGLTRQKVRQLMEEARAGLRKANRPILSLWQAGA